MTETTDLPVSEPISTDWLALAAALTTVILWASAFVGIRAVAEDLSPGALATGRLIVGSVALGVVVAIRRPLWPARRDLAWIGIVGVVWFGAYNVALNAAEQLIDAGTAAMLINIGPILIAVFAGFFLREGFPPRLVAGSAIAFGGAIVIGLATGDASADAAVPIGIALCVLAATAYAAGVTIQKPVLRRVAAIQVTWLACCVGAVVTLPFLPQLVGELRQAPMSAAGWILYLGIFPTAIAFTTWAFALNRTTAGRLGSTTYLVPPVAILLAWLILGEVPPVLAFLGGALCIGGVIVARSKGR